MYKILGILSLLVLLNFNAHAQNNSWKDRHMKAHDKEQLATNKSRLDASVIQRQIQEEVANREALEAGLSPEAAIMIDDLLKEASAHLGKRYSLGSKGPNAFDCSGFAGYVYRQFGYSIGASSRIQYEFGKPVDKKDLRKGDLVFFTSRSSGKAVGHVGIVWDVDKETGAFKFIHASTKGGVKISDFAGYYVNRYVGAKRVIE